MTAVSGTNELYGWAGHIASRTALRVNPGATLTLKEVGNPASPLVANQLYFSYSEIAGANTADIDAGTLELDLSGVIFETGITPQIAGGTVTKGFVVRNGGHLALKGSAGTFNSTKLELRGSVRVDSSALTLGLRNLLTVSSDLYLANATASLAEDASIIVSGETLVSGTNTISTTKANPPFGPGFRSAIALKDSSTVLNITGTGRAFSPFVTMSGGTLNLNLAPGSDPIFVFGDETAAYFFSGGGQVNISPGNFLEIRSGILDMDLGGSMAIHNEGTIWVEGGIFKGPGTVTGTGSVYVGVSGEIRVLNASSPLVLQQQQLDMALESTITLNIYPSNGTASRIEAAGVYLETNALPFAPVLNLQLSGDTALPVGTKFLLADYDQLTGNVNAPQFRGLPEGHVFQLGLNTYKIRYSDADYGASHGGNSSVITLTVVPSPYETWMAGYPGVPAGKRGPTDDGDGDGVANVVEFAHKGDPSNPASFGLMGNLMQDASPPTGKEFTLVIAVRDGAVFVAGSEGRQTGAVDGITCTVEASLDLIPFPGATVSHIGGPSDTAPAATGLPDLSGTPWEYHTFKLSGSESLPRGFMRTDVKITTIP